jgi:hypothetical protein
MFTSDKQKFFIKVFQGRGEEGKLVTPLPFPRENGGPTPWPISPQRVPPKQFQTFRNPLENSPLNLSDHLPLPVGVRGFAFSLPGIQLGFQDYAEVCNLCAGIRSGSSAWFGRSFHKVMFKEGLSARVNRLFLSPVRLNFGRLFGMLSASFTKPFRPLKTNRLKILEFSS